MKGQDSAEIENNVRWGRRGHKGKVGQGVRKNPGNREPILWYQNTVYWIFPSYYLVQSNKKFKKYNIVFDLNCVLASTMGFKSWIQLLLFSTTTSEYRPRESKLCIPQALPTARVYISSRPSHTDLVLEGDPFELTYTTSLCCKIYVSFFFFLLANFNPESKLLSIF